MKAYYLLKQDSLLLSLLKNEEEFQNVLQIVEEAITAVPSRRLKSDLIKSYDNE